MPISSHIYCVITYFLHRTLPYYSVHLEVTEVCLFDCTFAFSFYFLHQHFKCIKAFLTEYLKYSYINAMLFQVFTLVTGIPCYSNLQLNIYLISLLSCAMSLLLRILCLSFLYHLCAATSVFHQFHSSSVSEMPVMSYLLYNHRFFCFIIFHFTLHIRQSS